MELNRDKCGGPKCRGAKAVIAGSRITKDRFDRPTTITRLCADCIPLVPGAITWRER